MRLRCAAYAGKAEQPAAGLQRKLDVERSGKLISEQLRRVVRLKLRVPACNVSDAELDSLFHMLDFNDAGIVIISDLVDFILADAPPTTTKYSTSSMPLQAKLSATQSTSATRLTGSESRATLDSSQSPSRSTSPAGGSKEVTRSPSRLLSQEAFNLPAPVLEPAFEDQVLAASRRGNVSRLRRLLSKQLGPFEGPLAPEVGATCAHLAAGAGHVATCELLLRAHVSPDCRDANGATLLARAALFGHRDLVQSLLQQWRASPLDTDDAGRNAVHVACLGDIRVVKALVEHSPASAHARDALGRSCFYYALGNPRRDAQTRIAHFLVSCGCDPNAVDTDGRTALEYAGQAGNREVVSLFLSAGAQPSRTPTAPTNSELPATDDAPSGEPGPDKMPEEGAASLPARQRDAVIPPDPPYKAESLQLLNLIAAMATMPRHNAPAETLSELLQTYA